MNFEYYYGTQADQFSFIRIPRILLLDKAFSALSLSAKVIQYLRPYIAVGTKAGSTNLENAEKD